MLNTRSNKVYNSNDKMEAFKYLCIAHKVSSFGFLIYTRFRLWAFWCDLKSWCCLLVAKKFVIQPGVLLYCQAYSTYRLQKILSFSKSKAQRRNLVSVTALHFEPQSCSKSKIKIPKQAHKKVSRISTFGQLDMKHYSCTRPE